MTKDRSLQHLCDTAPKDCHASRAFLCRLRLYAEEAQGVVLDGWKGHVEFCSLLCLPSLYSTNQSLLPTTGLHVHQSKSASCYLSSVSKLCIQMIPPTPFQDFTLLEFKAYSALHCPTLGFRGASAYPCALLAASGCFGRHDGVRGVMRLQATHRYAPPKSSRTSVRLRLNDKQGTRHAVSLLVKHPTAHPSAYTIELLNVPPCLLAKPTSRLRDTVRTGFGIGRCHVQRCLLPQPGRCDMNVTVAGNNGHSGPIH